MRVAKGKRAVLVIATLATLLFSVAQINAAKPQDDKAAATTAAAGQYVGSETCRGCHEDTFKNIQPTGHATSALKLREGGLAQSCEACHGPGAEHVNSGGDPSKIFRFKGASANKTSERCLACHTFSQEHGNFQRSYHAKANVGCTSCHSPHYSKERALLVRTQPGLCYSCHGETRADFSKPFSHPVNEGFMTCSDCHNVHGAFQGRQLRATAGQNAVCFKCHTDKQGPFVFEHVPVRTEGCSSCHQVHGSTNVRMLRVSQVNLLCLQCHTTIATRISSNRVQYPSGPVHNQNSRYVACTMCHPMIHGSNGNPEFLK